MNRQSILATVILSTFLVAMLAPLANGQASGPPVSPEHQELAEDQLGEDAPYGPWARLHERNTFYLKGTGETEGALADYAAPPANEPSQHPFGYIDYELPLSSEPPDNADVTAKTVEFSVTTATLAAAEIDEDLSTSATFELTAPFSDDTRIYDVTPRIYGRCIGETRGVLGSSTSQIRMIMDIVRYAQDEDGNWVRAGDSALLKRQQLTPSDEDVLGAPDYSVYREHDEERRKLGNPALGNGKLVFAGEKLRLEFSIFLPELAVKGATCIISYDEMHIASSITMVSDSARVATWIEDPDGDPARGLPSGDQPAATRRFSAKTLYASTLPGLDHYGVDRSPYNYMVPGESGHVDKNDGDTHHVAPVMDSRLAWNMYSVDASEYVYTSGGTRVTGEVKAITRDPTWSSVGSPGGSMWMARQDFLYEGTLDDGGYQMQVTPNAAYPLAFGMAQSPLVTVGLKGLEFEPLDGSERTMNPGQTTQFRFHLENLGVTSDVFTVDLVSAPNNWDAVLETGRFIVPGGDEDEVVLTVTPPETAQATDPVATFVLTAQSAKFPGEVDPITQSVSVDLSDEVVRGVDVDLFAEDQRIAPGEEVRSLNLRVRNAGHAADLFVVTPSAPSFTEGWTFQIVPPSKTILAGSSQDFTLTIRAPKNAESGDQFELTVAAQRVGDALVRETDNMLIQVRDVAGFVLGDFTDVASIREPGVDFCQGAVANPNYDPYPPHDRLNELQQPEEVGEGSAWDLYPDCVGAGLGDDGTPEQVEGIEDTTWDPTALFRIPITNIGSSEDTFLIRGNWVDVPPNCEGLSTDNPLTHNWNVAWSITGGSDLGGPYTADGNAELGLPTPEKTAGFKIPAGESQDFWFHFGKNPKYPIGPQDCQDLAVQDPKIEFSIQSKNDAALTDTFSLQVLHEAAGSALGHSPSVYANTETAVDAIIDPLVGNVQENGEPGTPAVHRIRVVNQGNQHDAIEVDLSGGRESGGWTRSMEFHRTVINHGLNEDGEPICNPTNSPVNTTWMCRGLGAGDEAFFNITSEPGPDVPLGNKHPIVVNVQSETKTTANAVLSLVARYSGAFLYEAEQLQTQIEVPQGASGALPFKLDNVGTEADDFHLSVTDAPADWNVAMGSESPVRVPGQLGFGGFIGFEVPADAEVGSIHDFELQVASVGGGQFKELHDLSVRVVEPYDLELSGLEGNTIPMDGADLETGITVKAVDTTGGTGQKVTFTVRQDTLPSGWKVASQSITADFSDEGEATATFKVTPPATAVGATRAVLRVEAVTDHAEELESSVDLILDMADTYGVALEPVDEKPPVIVPGGEVTHKVNLKNLGLSADNIQLATSDFPAGWSVEFSPSVVRLGALSELEQEIFVSAPAGIEPGSQMKMVLFASSASDPGQIAQLELTTVVGKYEVAATGPNVTIKGAPQEELIQVVTVTNNGSLSDEIALGVILDTAALGADVDVTIEPQSVPLAANASTDVKVKWKLSGEVPSDVDLRATVTATSLLDYATTPSTLDLALTAHVLRYQALDVDEDGLLEYAIDRNEQRVDGFEEWRESKTPGGRLTTPVNIHPFLSDEAREGFMRELEGEDGEVTEYFYQFLDADKDLRMDHFIDDNGNGLPDIYWDPDRGHSHRISIFKDVNADNVPDYFIDTNDDDLPDQVFDITQGVFIPVILRDVDNDGRQDYVVDSNGNGRLDAEETVLYVRTGGLVTVQKVDVDGDGNLDDVFDVDGDGAPDYFIPAGSERSIEVVLEDVDGDGVLDWTFDADGDGSRESFYNPASGGSSLIDATGSFVDALIKYWYVGALFALVLVLFVVLVAVTRR